ncbi:MULTISPECIES: carbohydrate ABC transporter permease [Paenibacillus]|uniref:Carbohydrate ABC transporter permease n=1 Tax=Paenibacillus agaridevorans TaxID=171404 RepID=A0A2R5EMI9_9BACL|nr:MULTISPECIES: carbohydrate ABC transporter permease [Paenibacillus]QNK59188.1 carbohydrate ABC transporter permease [Paenibacillus sp. PAMC21692]GBG06859.1 carbohydrate ABC transporter permease [Paenibacillus agaridevorans]
MGKQRLSLFDIFNYAALTIFCLSILYPFVYLINMSLSTSAGLYSRDFALFLWPEGFTLEAYRKFLSMNYVYSGYGSTIFRTVAGTVLSLIVMSGAAYALSKKYLPHLKIYTTIFVITMFFGGGLIPSYLLMRNLGLLDNVWILVLGPMVNAFYLLIIRNFFMSIPEELEESARLDGAGDIKIFTHVIIPLSLPVIATIGLWQAVNHWNAWFDSLIYINSMDKHVISVHIRRLVIEQNAAMNDQLINSLGSVQKKDMPAPESIRAAAIMVTIIPILCVYPFIQRFFVRGVMVGAVKG